MNDSEKALLDEKEKRKELSRTRIFWFLVITSVALVIYIIIQFMILANQV